MVNNIIDKKSYSFAIRIVKLYKHLSSEKSEFVLSKQLMRSGTSIGANVREGINSVSTAEFIHKLNIALKEASESAYWIDLLHDTEYLTDAEYNSIKDDCNEIFAILTSIIKTTKKRSSF